MAYPMLFDKKTNGYKGRQEALAKATKVMFAHTTIVFTRYILLNLEARKAKDSRTFGGMFFGEH